MSDTKDKLDAIAAYYNAEATPDIRPDNAMLEHMSRAIAADLKAGERVLLLGYGGGVMAETIARTGVRLEIAEGAPTLVAAARRALSAYDVVCHETMFESFAAPAAFDVVLATFVLEHVEDPVALLRAVHVWLRPGGRAHLAVPNSGSLHRRLAVRMGIIASTDELSERDRVVGHRRVFDLGRLGEACRSAGLEVERETGFMLKVLPNGMMRDHSDALLDALNGISSELPPDMLANIAVVARRPLR